MPVYKPVYSKKFEDGINNFASNKEIKNGLEKAILFILENPYHKAVKVKGENGLMRKHVCTNKFRIFYYIDDSDKKIIFAMFRPKNKNTYKNL
jgi:mRNA-degrading endonuclease RelE of RelBE toxin-antitoxin system